MARVAFYQNVQWELHGVMSLAAALRRAGHECRVFIGDRELERSLAGDRPDIAAFTCSSAHARWTRDAARRVKSATGAPVIVGGIHPTFSPRSMLDEGAIDAVCVGEGERAFELLAERTGNGRDYEGIPNLVYRRGDDVVEAPLAPLLTDLDALPDPDRDVYYETHPTLARNPIKPFFIGRGCPYSCTFCFNGRFRKLYRAGSDYIRMRSPDRVLDEIERVRSRWGLSRIFFFDDIFTVDRAFTLDFLERYRRAGGPPFRCYVSVRHQDAELLAALRDAGCFHVEFGVESGNEEYRRKTLRKPFTNDQIRAAAANIRAAGLRFSTGNIFLMPGETFETALDTVRLNAEIRPDSVLANLFQPYRGLPLTDVGAEHGEIDEGTLDELEFASFRESPVRNPDTERIVRLHLLFGAAVRFPRLIGRLDGLCRLPLDGVYRVVFWLHYALTYPRRNPMSSLEALRMGVHWVRQFRSIFKE